MKMIVKFFKILFSGIFDILGYFFVLCAGYCLPSGNLYFYVIFWCFSLICIYLDCLAKKKGWFNWLNV